MRFADPTSCPNCSGAIGGPPACAHCGFDLVSDEARELWQTLLRADALLERAAQRSRVAATPPPAPAAPTTYPTPAAPRPATPGPHRPWPVGTILLVLGAFGLIVAGLIFVTRSWDSIGLAGKASILLGFTAVMGALGTWVTTRRLRASAEAVWSVFLALLTLDVFAARHEDLAGLGGLELAWMCVGWGVVALAVCVAIGLWARPRVSVELIAPAVAGGLAIALAGVGAGAVGDDLDVGWRTFIALVVAGVVALATRPAALPHLTLIARSVVVGFFGVAYLAAVVELVAHPALDDLVGGAHGLPMVLMGIASLVIGWLVPLVRIPASALAVIAAAALVFLPVQDAQGDDAGSSVVALLAVVLAAAGTRGANDWMRGVRIGAVPVLIGIAGLQASLAGDVLETIGRIFDDPWRFGANVRLDISAIPNHAGWAVLVQVVAFAVVAALVPRWPELATARPHVRLIVGSAVALGTLNAVVAWHAPLWAMAVVLLVLAAAMSALHLRGGETSISPVAGALVSAAALLAAGSQGVSAWAWIAGGVVLAALAWADGAKWLRQICAGLGVALMLGGLVALVDAVTDDQAVTALVIVAAALGFIAAAGLMLSQHPARQFVEGIAAVGLIIALVWAGSSAEVAVRWTVAGVALIALSFVVESRRWYVWPGIASLVVAYVALIVDSGFSFVEAYTLPLGAAALAAGLYLLRGRPDASTWTYLGPGLAIALLPSVPQALIDPTELRALVLGLAAIVVLAVGIRLDWQAPFAAGASILTLLVLFNIGPYANAAPRVVLIAAVSAVLLGVGISWEDRVRDGRKLVGYVRSMR